MDSVLAMLEELEGLLEVKSELQEKVYQVLLEVNREVLGDQFDEDIILPRDIALGDGVVALTLEESGLVTVRAESVCTDPWDDCWQQERWYGGEFDVSLFDGDMLDLRKHLLSVFKDRLQHHKQEEVENSIFVLLQTPLQHLEAAVKYLNSVDSVPEYYADKLRAIRDMGFELSENTKAYLDANKT